MAGALHPLNSVNATFYCIEFQGLFEDEIEAVLYPERFHHTETLQNNLFSVSDS
jgi:hypothetical protein